MSMRWMSPHLMAVLLSGTATHGQGADETSKKTIDRFQALKGEHKAAENAWAKRFDGEPGRADSVARYKEWPGWSFIPRFLELAEASPKDPATYDVLVRILEFGDEVSEMDRGFLPSFDRAMALLLRDYIQDRRLKRVCEMWLDTAASPPRERFLRAVLEQSRDREVRAWACFSLATCLAAKRDAALAPRAEGSDVALMSLRIDPSYDKYLKLVAPDSLYEQTKSQFERTIKEFGDIKIEDERFHTMAAAAKFFLNKFAKASIGREAAEVEGEDAYGRKFKLSDYRGKILVLTFSGNWCGPCRSMYPHERELVKRLIDKPFALLSVNTDEDRKTLREAIQAGEITWRCWWESGLEGPICSQWSNVGFPNIYVIDPKGTIRYKFEGPPDPPTALDDAVESLLAEMTISTPKRR
jgi:thiol-disulfide isomerase/thioredoxin